MWKRGRGNWDVRKCLGQFAAVLFFILFQIAGLSFSLSLFPAESRPTKLLLGSLLGNMALQWFPIPFSFFLGFTKASHILALSAVLLLSAFCFWKNRKKILLWEKPQQSIPRLLRRQKFFWVVLGLWVFYCFLVHHSFRWEENGVYSSQATYGDMSMHLSFLTSLARQGTFPPDYSILPGTPLSYPFLSDSISSSLLFWGASLELSYKLPMWVAGAQVLFGCWIFLRRLLKGKEKQAALAWIFFFFNGGLGFLYFLPEGLNGFRKLFYEFYQTPTNLIDKNIRWVNVIVDMMLPQRATLFGWAVLFPLLYVLYRAIFEGKKKYFLIAGVLSGLLPMIHTHSFLVFALVCGVWLFYSLLQKQALTKQGEKFGKAAALFLPLVFWLFKPLLQEFGLDDGFFPGLLLLLFLAAGMGGILFLLTKNRAHWRALGSTWGLLFLAACILALPQLLYWTFPQANSGNFLNGHLCWVIGEEDYLWFYLKNIGVVAVFAFLGLLKSKNGQFVKYVPALAIWFVAELVIFQPNEYDNNKLLYPAFAFLCCPAAEAVFGLLEKLRTKTRKRAAGTALLVVCTVSALLTMGREVVASYQLFGTGALELCGYIEENLPADAIVLTNSRHNNEIASLAGRNILCGSPSFLYFHGVDYSQNEAAVKTMYEAPEASRNLFARFQVNYILLSDFERNSYQVDQEALDRMFPRIYENDGWILYQVPSSS